MKTPFYVLPKEELKARVEDFDFTEKVYLKAIEKEGNSFSFYFERYGVWKGITLKTEETEENFIVRPLETETKFLFLDTKDIFFDKECLVILEEHCDFCLFAFEPIEATPKGVIDIFEGQGSVGRAPLREQMLCKLIKQFWKWGVESELTRNVLKFLKKNKNDVLLPRVVELFLSDGERHVMEIVSELRELGEEFYRYASELYRATKISKTKFLPPGLLLFLEGVGFDTNRFFQPEKLNKDCRLLYYRIFQRLPRKIKRKLGKLILSSTGEFQNFVHAVQ